MSTNEIWGKCLTKLEHDLPEQEFNMWVRPLQASTDGDNFRLLAPNRFVKDWLDVNLADALAQGQSCLTVATVVPEEVSSAERLNGMSRSIESHLAKQQVQALVKVIPAKDIVSGAEALIKAYGFGPIAP